VIAAAIRRRVPAFVQVQQDQTRPFGFWNSPWHQGFRRRAFWQMSSPSILIAEFQQGWAKPSKCQKLVNGRARIDAAHLREQQRFSLSPRSVRRRHIQSARLYQFQPLPPYARATAFGPPLFKFEMRPPQQTSVSPVISACDLWRGNSLLAKRGPSAL